MFSRTTFKQFIFFTAIGGIGTAGQYVTLVVLAESRILTPVPASIAGFTVGAIINYFLNYRFTFNSNKSHKEAMTKFFVVAIFGAIINTALMYIGIGILQQYVGSSTQHFYYLLPQIVATGIVLLWNFAANKLWTFRQEA